MSNSNQDHSNQSGDDKLDMQSPDLVSQNFEKLAELFPNCVTESRNEKGDKTDPIIAIRRSLHRWRSVRGVVWRARREERYDE